MRLWHSNDVVVELQRHFCADLVQLLIAGNRRYLLSQSVPLVSHELSFGIF